MLPQSIANSAPRLDPLDATKRAFCRCFVSACVRSPIPRPRHEACYASTLVKALVSHISLRHGFNDPRRSKLARLFRRTRSAGFTLTEILVVIVMIAILAAVASPSFIKIMRDIGVSRLTQQFAEIYRRAYVDSSERQTTLVRFRYGGSGLATPMFETRKAQIDNGSLSLVAPRRCNSIDWNAPTIERTPYNFSKVGVDEIADVEFSTNNNTMPLADICFSRRRAFIRIDDGAFAEMTQSSRLLVKNLKTGLVRRVFVPANGLPRLAQ